MSFGFFSRSSRLAKVVATSLPSIFLVAGCAAEGPSPETSGTPVDEGTLATTSDALTGTTCAASVSDDQAFCVELGTASCYRRFSDTFIVDPSCLAKVKDQCKAAATNASWNCNFTQNAEIFRVLSGAHYETKVFASGAVEAKFVFSSKPVVGANQNPIYRCRLNSKWAPIRDFPSRDANCEGHGPAISVLGYDWPTSKPGVKPVYRCRTDLAFAGVDHFLSWSSTCEGKVRESIIGYAY